MPLTCPSPECGLRNIAPGTVSCPACDTRLQGVFLLGLLEADVAHGGQTVEMARNHIITACDQAMLNGHRGLKVIHGYGSSGSGARIKPDAIASLRTLAVRYGGKVVADKQNPGASILYFADETRRS